MPAGHREHVHRDLHPGSHDHALFHRSLHAQVGSGGIANRRDPAAQCGHRRRRESEDHLCRGEIEQRPRIETQSWQLYFETLDSTLYDRNHRPARVAGMIWELVSTHIHEYLSATRIDLAPPVSELKIFLQSLFLPESKNRAKYDCVKQFKE